MPLASVSWSDERWAEFLGDPLGQAWFITQNEAVGEAGPQYAGIAAYLLSGDVSGGLDGGPDGCRDGAPDGGVEVQISHFGLVPEFVGRSVGGHALTLAIQTGWDLSPTTSRVWLHTSTLDHPNALPNYQKRGFRTYETKVRED